MKYRLKLTPIDMAQAKEEVVFKTESSTDMKSVSKSILSSITVEPLVLFYILPSTMNVLITQSLIFEESCSVKLGFNQSVCEAITQKNASGYTTAQEISVQEIASDAIFVKTLTHGVIPLILLLFIGSWSDKHNMRKPCILGPIIGELVAITFLIFNSVYSYKLPPLLTALAYSLPMAISGGSPCLFLGVYSYVTTCSSEKNLTARIGGVSTIRSIAYVIGLGLSGIILNLLGFIGAYTTIFFMVLSSLVYGYYIIKDRDIIVSEVEEEMSDLKRTPEEIRKEIYILEHFFHTVRVFLTEKPSNRRMRLVASVVLLMIINGPLKGEQTVFFLYTKYRFGWNHYHYGIFFAIQFVIEIMGSLVALLLSKYFKWKDEALGVLSFSSSIVSCIIFAFANNGILFFVGAVMNLFNGTSQIALRSLMSKLVQNHEIGKTNSIFEISEAMTHLIFGTLYTILYRHTVHVFPGSIFVASSMLKAVGILIFIWLFHQSMKYTGKKEDIMLADGTDMTL